MGHLINPISFRLGTFCLNNSIWGINNIKRVKNILLHKDLQIYKFLFFYYSLFRTISIEVNQKKGIKKNKNLFKLNGKTFRILNTNGYIFFYYKKLNLYNKLGYNLRVSRIKTKYRYLSDIYIVRFNNIINIRIIFFDLNDELFFNKYIKDFYSIKLNFGYLNKLRNKKILFNLRKTIFNFGNIGLFNYNKFLLDFEDFKGLKKDLLKKYYTKIYIYKYNNVYLRMVELKILNKNFFKNIFFGFIFGFIKNVQKRIGREKKSIFIKEYNFINKFIFFYKNTFFLNFKNKNKSYIKLNVLKNSIIRKKIYVNNNKYIRNIFKRNLLYNYFTFFFKFGDFYFFYYFFNMLNFKNNIFMDFFKNNFFFNYYYLLKNNSKTKKLEKIYAFKNFKECLELNRLKKNEYIYDKLIKIKKNLKKFEKDLLFKKGEKNISKKDLYEKLIYKSLYKYYNNLGNSRDLLFKLDIEYDNVTKVYIYTNLYLKINDYDNIFYNKRDIYIQNNKYKYLKYKYLYNYFLKNYELLGLNKVLDLKGYKKKFFKEKKFLKVKVNRFKKIFDNNIKNFILEYEDLLDYKILLSNNIFKKTLEDIDKFVLKGLFNYNIFLKKNKKKNISNNNEFLLNQFHDLNFNSNKVFNFANKMYPVFMNKYNNIKLYTKFLNRNIKKYYFKIILRLHEIIYIKNLLYNFNKKYLIIINYFQTMLPSAYVLGIYVKKYLEIGKHFTLNRVIYPIINNIVKYYPQVKSIQVCCKGRFTKRQRASYLWFTNFGAVSYSTKNVLMDFSKTPVFLKYGVGGVRIWLVFRERSLIYYSSGFF